MVLPLAERRARLSRLLTEASSQKLLRDEAEHAVALAREAYALAQSPTRLEPWAALAAYRLGHLTLRRPRSREVLEEAEALFAEAAREPLLGPYPRIYRLALLHRLDAPRALVERSFREAASAHDAWVRARPAAEAGVSASIQTDLFALLELAGYFLDLERGPLEGRGARPDEPLLRDACWRIVGPDRALSDVLVSEATASAELESLAPELGARLVFRLPPDRAQATVRVPEGAWKPLPHRAARLLACLSMQDAAEARSLVERVMGGDGRAQQTAFRQVRHRLVEQLAELGIALSGELVVASPGERPRLSPELVVLGAVSESGYRDSE